MTLNIALHEHHRWKVVVTVFLTVFLTVSEAWNSVSTLGPVPDFFLFGIKFTQVLGLSSESHFVSCQHVCICIYHLSSVNMYTKEIKFKPNLLLENVSEVKKPLTDICNKSLQERKVPEEWKLANITPLHKKRSKTSTENYHTISLTSMVSKLMEKRYKR